jgi:hypothetical protein
MKDEIIPIGRRLNNYAAYVVDDDAKPVPVGFPGELHRAYGGSDSSLSRTISIENLEIVEMKVTELLFKTKIRCVFRQNIQFCCDMAKRLWHRAHPGVLRTQVARNTQRKRYFLTADQRGQCLGILLSVGDDECTSVCKHANYMTQILAASERLGLQREIVLQQSSVGFDISKRYFLTADQRGQCLGILLSVGDDECTSVCKAVEP